MLVFLTTYFVHNDAATISYDRKDHLDIRNTHLELDEEFLFNESDERDLLQTPEQALIKIKIKCIGHIHVFSRCYYGCIEMLVLLALTVQ